MRAAAHQGLAGYLGDDAMAALWSDAALLADMLRFEAALADAQARHGVIEPAAAALIGTVCAALRPDPQAIGQAARVAGTLAIPLVQALRSAVAECDAAVAAQVHHGATSQDVIDTAMMLRAAAALDLLEPLLAQTGDALAQLAVAHARTAMTGRTLLQAAVPIPFGAKVAVWLSGLSRSRRALHRLRHTQLMLQFGGAAGTLHLLGAAAPAVTHTLAHTLGLQVAPIPWHAQRDCPARFAGEVSILCGVLAKIGRDVALLMQDGTAEVSEPQAAGRGISSAMAHKHNPVGCMAMIEAAHRTAGLHAVLLGELAGEHERAVGAWQNQVFVLRELFVAAGSAARAAHEVCTGLQVDAARMQANLLRSAQGQFDPALDTAAAQWMIDAVVADWRRGAGD